MQFSDALGLPPKYIRQRFEHFKERKNQQQKKQQEEADRAFRERHKPPKPHKPKPKSQYSKFEDETMEKAYMRTVKMNPSSYESRDLLESISISLRMSLIKVHEWFNNRKFVDSVSILFSGKYLGFSPKIAIFSAEKNSIKKSS